MFNINDSCHFLSDVKPENTSDRNLYRCKILEDTGVLVFVVQNDNIIYHNKLADNIFHLKSESLSNYNFFRLFENSDIGKLKLITENVIEKKKISQISNYKIIFDGILYYFDITVSYLNYDNKPALLFNLLDNSEKNITIENFKRNEDILRYAIEQINAVFWTVDDQLIITFSIGGSLKNINLKPGELDGVSLYDFFDDRDDYDIIINNHLKALNGEHITYEMTYSGQDFLIHLKPLIDENNSIIGVSGIGMNVSELNKTKKQSLKSEQEYKTLIENTKEGILVVQDQLIKFFNKSVIEISDFDDMELLNSPLDNILFEDDIDYVISTLNNRLNEQIDVEDFTFRLITKKKKIRTIQSKIALVDWEEKPALLVFMNDITDRIQAEKISTAMFLIAKSINITQSINDLFKDIHIALSEIIVAKNFFIALYDKNHNNINFPYFVDEIDDEFTIIDAKDSGSLTAEVIRSGKPLLIRKSDMIKKYSDDKDAWGTLSEIWLGVPLRIGTEITGAIAVQSYDNPLQYSDDDIYILETLAEQIAIAIGRRLAEENLKLSEEKFKLAFVTSPDAIAINRLRDGMYVEINDGFTKLTGYTKEEIVNRTSFEINIWHDIEDRKRLVDTLIQTGYYKNLDTKFLLKNGDLKNALMSANLIQLNGETHILSITRDTDEIKKAREEVDKLNIELEQRVIERTAQLRDAIEELKSEIEKRNSVQKELERYQTELALALEKEKEISALKSRFISMVSHEYRTPLTVIYTSSELLDKFFHTNDKEKHDKHLDRIKLSVNNMTQLLDDVLFIGKSEAGLVKVNIDRVNLTELIYMIIEEYKVLDKETHEINYEYSDSELCIDTDRKLINQIVSNLLSNALKYSKAGLSVDIELINNSDHIQISIHDYGIGISVDDSENIYEHFYRGINIGTISGTGLGLSIVKRCVESLHGFITYSSELNVGTSFTVKLPKNLDVYNI